MASISKGYTFGATETVTNTSLHGLVDDATVTGIVNADIAAGAAIDESKLNISGSSICLLTSNQTVAGVKTFSSFAVTPSAAPTTDYQVANKKYVDDNVIPSGTIVMWSGAISAIPSGWVICDGANSTPDLTDRFVLHADADSGGTNDVGDTGGASTHKHTIALDDTFTSGSVTTKYFARADSSTTDDTYTVSNVPKYYALAYIMKS